LYLPEYGRHIHEMVDSLLEIEDRAERTRQAKAVIAVMGNLNPLLRDTADFAHKLWDHLFIMSDFQLDVDSPYAVPTRQDVMVKPRPLPYPQSRIVFKHYGKYVARMLKQIAEEGGEYSTERAVDNIARFMRAKSFEYNHEHPNNEIIIKDIKQMADNGIRLDEVALNNIRNDYKQTHPQQHPQKGGKRQAQHPQKGGKNARTMQMKNRAKNNQRHNTQK
jgi:hypothetical protein